METVMLPRIGKTQIVCKDRWPSLVVWDKFENLICSNDDVIETVQAGIRFIISLRRSKTTVLAQ